MAKTFYLYLRENGQDSFVGTIRFEVHRGKEICSFSYDEGYLERPNPLRLDGSLYLQKGYQYSNEGMFPFIEDMLPDRWGRALIRRKEAREAKRENRTIRTLLESDYLASIDDAGRKGALRIKAEKDGDFISPFSETSIPPDLFLNHLEQMAKSFEEGDDIEDKAFMDILRQGSSLGGARPKANVYGSDGRLYLAKFPSKHDEYDVGAFEKLSNELASLAGISVPTSSLKKLSPQGSTFIAERFDREKGERIHFVSAMCLLDAKDGEEGHGYLELADFIKGNSVSPNEDLRELFRRIAFNIAIGNSDDHLRNHGFLLSGNGYRLSPAYDLNPGRYGNSLSLLIDEDESTMSFSLLKSTCRQYGLSPEEADGIIGKIKEVLSDNLLPLAKRLGISQKELEWMKPAFDLSKRD